ncbi:protein of unknown function [Candidatus Nitrosocosmicus franklandus]|uniref:Uncharacterized protein n=1 Tax=Candidatus Nitrosocosmicus franklandianus TaxID=1798806 RepID=A0A484IH30_9ARCH|nr:protein of unknown function [Candidatus Nitrosocosmicus franklandus]
MLMKYQIKFENTPLIKLDQNLIYKLIYSSWINGVFSTTKQTNTR